MSSTICMLVSNSLKKDPRVQREAQAAYSEGFNVVVVGLEDQYFDNEFLISKPFTVDVIRLGRGLRDSKNFFIRAIRCPYRFLSFILKTTLHNPRIIHCNDLDTLLQGWIASLLCGAKVVYDSHEVNTAIGEKKTTIGQKADMLRERFLVKKVDQVVSVSNAAAKLIGDYYGIHPIVVTNCSYTVPIDYAKEKNSQRFDVLYHGIMSKDRGYEEFVLSATLLSGNVRIILRGYGPLENELRQLVRINNLWDKVIFAPPVEIKDLITIASESRVGVVLTKPVNPNFTYTVGNKIFEYINAGLPVIMSDVPEHRYLNEKFNFGLIVTEVTPEKIADAINELMTNEKRYEKLRNNAITASRILSWEQESIKLIQIYRRLLTDNQ